MLMTYDIRRSRNTYLSYASQFTQSKNSLMHFEKRIDKKKVWKKSSSLYHACRSAVVLKGAFLVVDCGGLGGRVRGAMTAKWELKRKNAVPHLPTYIVAWERNNKQQETIKIKKNKKLLGNRKELVWACTSPLLGLLMIKIPTVH